MCACSSSKHPARLLLQLVHTLVLIKPSSINALSITCAVRSLARLLEYAHHMAYAAKHMLSVATLSRWLHRLYCHTRM